MAMPSVMGLLREEWKLTCAAALLLLPAESGLTAHHHLPPFRSSLFQQPRSFDEVDTRR